MPITVILELRLKPESVPAARDVMRRALQDTRAFDGNLGTDVLVDQDDERGRARENLLVMMAQERALLRRRQGGARFVTQDMECSTRARSRWKPTEP